MHQAAVLVEDQYQVLEVWYPYLRLKEEGIKAVLVGTGAKREYKSKEGYPAAEDLTIQEARAGDFNAVVIPGGYAPDILRRYKEVNNFVRDMFKEGKVVASMRNPYDLPAFCREIIKQVKKADVMPDV